ncbi:MAG TPA: hypothetical protein VMA95_17655 [Streptosporangiaceae bacterium]|nr:hypothetical protein [Streptosporangiaceae bacterium]
MTIRRGLGGAVVAVDSATGKTLFTSGRPMAWDSSDSGPIRTAPSAGYSGSGRVFNIPVLSAKIQRTAEARRAEAAETLAVPTTGPAGSKIKFPEYVDPEISDSGTQYYAEVANFGGYWNTTTGTTSVGSGVVEVGDCGYSDCEYEWDGTVYQGYVNRAHPRPTPRQASRRSARQARTTTPLR